MNNNKKVDYIRIEQFGSLKHLKQICLYITSKQLSMGNKHNFEEIRERTITDRNRKIETFLPVFKEILDRSKLYPERIDSLTRMSLSELVQQLNTGAVTSEQLVAIYGQRAATIGRQNCIITDENFQYALKRAAQCDQERRKTKKLNWTMEDEWNMEKYFPPLFGIPTSIKDNIDMAGTRSTLGATIRAEKIIEQDCATVKCMKRTGLIPFIKTNLPQLTFNFDSHNFLWGRTLNPWNRNKSPGGSSGGEGAAISSRVSPIGMGNDMAGSIRIPAAFNGVCGLCPSADRLPFMGQQCKFSNGFEGLDTIMGVNGPLAKYIDDLVLWMKNMTTEEFYLGEHDPYKKLISFDIKTFRDYSQGKKKLRIGYLQSLELIEPTQAVRRAVRQTVEFLRSQGYELVQIKMPNQTQLLMSCFTELLCQGDMASFLEILEGQPVVEEYSQLQFLSKRGFITYALIGCIVNRMYPRLGLAVEASRKRTTHEYLENAGRMHEMKAEWISFWRKQKLDFLIFPGFATEATSHGSSKDGSYLAAYTYVFNILKMAACSLPITVTKGTQLDYESQWNDPVTDLIKNNLKDAEGLPVSVQVVGLPYEEEKILGLAKRIERHFKFTNKHPYPNIG